MKAFARVAVPLLGLSLFACRTPEDGGLLDEAPEGAGEETEAPWAGDGLTDVLFEPRGALAPIPFGFLFGAKTGMIVRTSGCPKHMVRVGTSCIDRYEAPNIPGAKPLVMQTADEAEAYCERHKKRLCTEDEWISACEGGERRAYPYGGDHEEARCNDDKVWRQVNEAVLARWPSSEAKAHNDSLYQAARSGTKKRCVSRYGVYDLTGNVEEWVRRTRAGHSHDYAHILKGCYWAGCYGGGKPTCLSSNAAHGPGFRFYETGFRCCKDAQRK